MYLRVGYTQRSALELMSVSDFLMDCLVEVVEWYQMWRTFLWYCTRIQFYDLCAVQV